MKEAQQAALQCLYSQEEQKGSLRPWHGATVVVLAGDRSFFSDACRAMNALFCNIWCCAALLWAIWACPFNDSATITWPLKLVTHNPFDMSMGRMCGPCIMGWAEPLTEGS